MTNTIASIASLPPQFADLERYTAGWGSPASDARHHKRQTSAMAEITEFYDAISPRLDAIFEHLDRFDAQSLAVPEQNLLNLTFGFIEASLAVEIFKCPGVPGAPYPDAFFSVSRELV